MSAAVFLACFGFTNGLAAVAYALIARPARKTGRRT